MWPGVSLAPARGRRNNCTKIGPLVSLFSRSIWADFLWKRIFCCKEPSTFYANKLYKRYASKTKLRINELNPAGAATSGLTCWTRMEDKSEVCSRHTLRKSHWLLLWPFSVCCRLRNFGSVTLFLHIFRDLLIIFFNKSVVVNGCACTCMDVCASVKRLYTWMYCHLEPSYGLIHHRGLNLLGSVVTCKETPESFTCNSSACVFLWNDECVRAWVHYCNLCSWASVPKMPWAFWLYKGLETSQWLKILRKFKNKTSKIIQ